MSSVGGRLTITIDIRKLGELLHKRDGGCRRECGGDTKIIIGPWICPRMLMIVKFDRIAHAAQVGLQRVEHRIIG